MTRPAHRRVAASDARLGVLFVNTKTEITPIQQVHAAIAAHLDPSRFRVFVVTPADCDTEAAWDLSPDVTIWRRRLGVSLRASSLAERLRALIRNLSLIRDIADLSLRIRAHRIRIIHTATTPRDVLMGVTLSAVTGARLVIHWHDTFWGRYPLLWRIGFRRATRIFAVSEASKLSLVAVGVPAEKFTVIHNGVDLDRFRPRTPDPAVRRALRAAPDGLLVLMPGRLCPGKGQAELLAALALLRARGLRPTTLVVGKDDPWSTPGRRSHRAHLEALARQLGIDDQVQFSAPRADMPDLMAAADVVTVPSWTEPCGLVILETLASGRALLGTTGGGTAELIDTEVDGLLVPPRDSSSLAAALERLLTDAALRADLGARARRKAERCFSTRRMVADAERAYLEIAQDGAATGVAVASVAGARAGHRAARHPMGVRRPQP